MMSVDHPVAVAEAEPLATALFPSRVPETSEVMTPEESTSLAAWRATPLGYAVYAGLAAHIVDRLGIQRGRIVSVGEGEGFLAARIAAQLPEATVIGTDICPAVVEMARARHRAPNLSYEVVPAGELGGLRRADAIVCAFALHHFTDPRGAIASMVRLLDDGGGGRLYVQDLRRDARLNTYFRVLDMYVAHNLTVAGLFRASVNAAYTRTELADLLAPHEGTREVGVIRFGQRARAAYLAAADESTLSSSLETIEGLWVEGLLDRSGAVIRPT
jgi:ubiquinone/menaquinone biosynthesis C-methylase UbiE